MSKRLFQILDEMNIDDGVMDLLEGKYIPI